MRGNEKVIRLLNERDNGTRTLFERMLHDEEGHADFLDTQLSMIGELSLATYLSRQMSNEEKAR